MPRLVALTTDFGTRDPYVAAMKGVLYARCPDVQVVDLTHEIPAQDVSEGARFIAEAAPSFPEETIHCVVVDPGVGTQRLPIIVRAGSQYFVCPDNGILEFFTSSHPVEEAHVISNPEFMRDTISATFHGRDIFAPAAARLASGASIQDAGERLVTLMALETPKPYRDEHGRLHGVVLHVDRFGNAITNLHREDLHGVVPTEVRLGTVCLAGLAETYGDADEGCPLALFGSSDYLEIAVNRGNAQEVLGLDRNQKIEVRF